MILGFVSDAHGCVEALDKALDVLARRGAEQVFHLGDSIGYFPGWAAADRLRDLKIPSLLGNHEQMLAEGTTDPDKDRILGLELTNGMATPEQLRWASTLPSSLTIGSDSAPILLVHGSPSDPINGYVYPDTPLDGLDPGNAMAVFMGHTHHPCIRESGGVLFVNVGSCALPRDEKRLGCVCLWDTKARTARLERFGIGREARRAAERCRVHGQILAKISTMPDSAHHALQASGLQGEKP